MITKTPADAWLQHDNEIQPLYESLHERTAGTLLLWLPPANRSMLNAG